MICSMCSTKRTNVQFVQQNEHLFNVLQQNQHMLNSITQRLLLYLICTFKLKTSIFIEFSLFVLESNYTHKLII